jgi:hypothetical protein
MDASGAVNYNRNPFKSDRPVSRWIQVTRHDGQQLLWPSLPTSAYSNYQSPRLIVSQQALYERLANKPCCTGN